MSAPPTASVRSLASVLAIFSRSASFGGRISRGTGPRCYALKESAIAMTTLPGMATEVAPLFAGRCGPLWHVECTGLGLSLAARALPTSLHVVVSPAVSNPAPT